MSKEAPYLAFEFDALEHCAPLGAACGLKEEQACLSLLKLWRFCWRQKTEHVTTTHILGFFYGVNACESLMAFGFIAASKEGWRVRGADRWLFIQRSRSENGKRAAANGNLKRGHRSPAPLQQTSSTPSNSGPALTATSDQRQANSVKDLLPHPIQAAWNAFRRKPLPEWTSTEGKRKTHADARWAEHPDPDFWRDVMAKILKSNFLSGRKNDFKATPDWIINPSNLTKVLEGNYDDTGPVKGSASQSQTHWGPDDDFMSGLAGGGP